MTETNQGLYQKHRPTTFKEVLGQPEAVNTLRKHLQAKTVPHALLLTGPSGCGKTTLARILRRALDCDDADFCEVNAADYRGIEMVRDIRSRVGLSPLAGTVRVWLIDEVAQLTSAAQDSFLKLLEDPPGHVYFILATTDPQKLKATIITRCEEIKVKALSVKALERLVVQTYEAECGVGLSEEIADKIVDIADGSARKALVLLSQVMAEDDEDKQLRMLGQADSKRHAIELCRLMLKPGGGWGEAAKMLKEIGDDPETVRYIILGYMRTVLLGGGKMAPRAAEVMDRFQDNFYDSKQAGLALACWDILN